jgi:hypothetical protein
VTILAAFQPPLQRGLTADAQPGVDDTVGASPLRDSRPIKKSQVCAGTSLSVGIEEMIGGDVVLVDGLFHQTHSENACIKRVIARGVCRDRCEMMDTVELHDEILYQMHEKLLIASL